MILAPGHRTHLTRIGSIPELKSRYSLMSINILLVEDDHEDAELLDKLLKEFNIDLFLLNQTEKMLQ